ncbi:putative bifunctional diguanylate cyclase/phosphodiesterase [Thioclava kandeliae]|uniref:Bifunctional diguanylate cyclase/phosphodiesterase n=1 Tax=Thioclava kandeliae TaxID=3070818 RepID=A0ABV1SBW6_9RHOB
MPQKTCPKNTASSLFSMPLDQPAVRGRHKLRELELRNLQSGHTRDCGPAADGRHSIDIPPRAHPTSALITLAEYTKRLTGAEYTSITLLDTGHHETTTERAGDLEAHALAESIQDKHAPHGTRKIFHSLSGNHSYYRLRLLSDAGHPLGFLNVVFPKSTPDDSARRSCLETTADLLGQVLTIHIEKQALEENYTASQLREKKLERQAEVDPLTQVENHSAFERKVQERLTILRTKGSRAAFIMLDIDHFKSINDLYGHSFGDKYLRVISSAISSAFPPPALIGRLGGDEFGVLVETGYTSEIYLEMLLSRCRAAVQRGAAMLGKGDLGRVSIGASLFPEQSETYGELFELADSALYASKHAGRAVNTVFSESHHDKFNSRAIGRRFERAIAEDLLEPYFQPIISTASGARLGYEILARWRDPERGILMPDAFASVFKDYRLAETLTRTMIQRALTAYVSAGLEREPGPPVTLSINLTSFDLLNPEFVFDMQLMLNTHGLEWDMITIEVTEKVMLDERSGQMLRSLQEMRTRGATVALDDFGTGYAGLRHLADWPVDILKIDRSFCAKITETASDKAIAEGILLIAQRCGYQVVAEGVETPSQLDALRALGCPRVQGFLFARPMSSADLARAPSRYIVAPHTVN